MKRIVTTFVTLILLLTPLSGWTAPLESGWEVAAPERIGSEQATGALLYFKEPVLGIRESVSLPFREIARAARFDVLQLSWPADLPHSVRDPALLEFTAAEIRRLRQLGYSRIVLAGEGDAAWLAVSAASSVEVDGLITLGPGAMRTPSQHALPQGSQLDELAAMLAKTKARRVAMALFRGDALDGVDGGRASAFRRSLRQAAGTYVLIDRPPDITDGLGPALGRFTRRYRDCLVDLVLREASPGERTCDLSKGYAAGRDAAFADQFSGPPLARLPVFSDPSLARFLGRWQGDDATGTSVILDPVEIGQSYIDFRHIYAPGPEWLSTPPSVDIFRFRLSRAGRVLAHSFDDGEGWLRQRMLNELEYVLYDGKAKPQQKFLLKRQRD